MKMQLARTFTALSVLFFIVAFTEGAPHTNRFSPLGEFTSIHQDAEHCSGYAVDLWQSNSLVFGTFHACAGMVGDIPFGMLEETHFDKATHALSFTSTLSLGSDYLSQEKQVPSRDRYKFNGTLERTTISGTLSHVDEAATHPISSTQKLLLKRGQAELPSFNSVEALKAHLLSQIAEHQPKP